MDKNSWVSDGNTFATGLCLHVNEAGHSVIENPGKAGKGKNGHGGDIINTPLDYY